MGARVTRRAPLLLLVLALVGPAAAPAADLMRKQPYLIYPGQPGQMQVLWQLAGTDTCRLAWGTDTTCALDSERTVEYGTDHQHTYTITGLAPATKYYFRETNEGYAYRGSFTSAPAPEAARVKFFAYGDTRSTPSEHDLVAQAMIATFTADPGYQTMTLQMGDYATQGGVELYWTSDLFHPAYPNLHLLLASLAYQGVMGNHEVATPVLFTKYLPYPWVAGRYWSFDYGPAHFAMVDQYTAWGPGSAQLQWLANDLATTTKLWKFVVLHEPGWSSGNAHPNNPAVQAYIQPLCQQYDVAILFAGHNHNYCRAVVNGVQHITTGGGGAPPESPLPGQPNVVIAAGGGHFCKIAIDGGVLSFQAIRVAGGTVIDSFTLVRPFSDTSAPTVRLASPSGGETWKAGSTHAITWSAVDNLDVAAEDVAWSTDGGATYSTPQPAAPGAGSLAWTVPDVATAAARVRVTARDAAGNAASAASGDFTIDHWLVTATAGPGGTIVPSGAVPVCEGASPRFSIRPARGNRLAALRVDGVAVPPDTSFTFAPVAANHEIQASFAGPLMLARPQPNPGGGTTLLNFELPYDGTARLEILDLSGRIVWRRGGEFAAGPNHLRWEGVTTTGDRAANGLYFVRLVTPWGTRTQRLVWRR